MRPQEEATITFGQAETILLVEDEPGLLTMSRRMLEVLGYNVLPASTPGEAIQLTKEYDGKIHLFLTDVVMPEMNGRELIDQLLLIRPDTTYLFMSGYTADVIIHRGVSRKGDNFIQKPFSLTQIAAQIRTLLDGCEKTSSFQPQDTTSARLDSLPHS
nr:response regulator [uncultured Desulfobulbus sp.]